MQENTIQQAMDQGIFQLPRSSTAKLDCELLLSLAINKNREYLYSHPEYILGHSEYSDFNSLLQKRADGYPIAYLTGTKEFWSMTFMVNNNTLIPRPETECLVEVVLEFTPANEKFHILDLGTGSGAIVMALAKERPLSKFTATDICPYALAIAKQNARNNKAVNINFIKSDWFSEINQDQFDVIVSNPPYVESASSQFIQGDIRHEPRLALDGGINGMDAYIRIIPGSARRLKPGGLLVLEHGYLQANDVRQSLSQNGFSDIQTLKDYSGNERLSTGRAPV